MQWMISLPNWASQIFIAGPKGQKKIEDLKDLLDELGDTVYLNVLIIYGLFIPLILMVSFVNMYILKFINEEPTW